MFAYRAISRKFSFARLASKNANYLVLQKQAATENLALTLSRKWFPQRGLYYIKLHKYKSLFASVLFLLDYNYHIFLKIFNFFTDGRIKRFLKNKLYSIKPEVKSHEFSEVISQFSQETVKKYSDFFIETDKKLLKGIPRWMVVESVVEEFGISENDQMIVDFYRIKDNNRVKPKSYNFSLQDMFQLLENVEKKVGTPIEERIPSFFKRVEEKIPRALKQSAEWVKKNNDKTMKIIDEIKGVNIVVAVNPLDLELEKVREQISELRHDKNYQENMEPLIRKLQELEKKKNRMRIKSR